MMGNIMFSAPMVRAILEGRKTQTRRILTGLRGTGFNFGHITEFGRSDTPGYDWHFRDQAMRWNDLHEAELQKALSYQVGDALWVRESVRAFERADGLDMVEYIADGDFREIAATSEGADAWIDLAHYGSRRDAKKRGAVVPARYMPRWCSRIEITVSAVKVERLQDISEADAKAEAPPERSWRKTRHREDFAALWDSIYGLGHWMTNPWVTAITFTASIERGTPCKSP